MGWHYHEGDVDTIYWKTTIQTEAASAVIADTEYIGLRKTEVTGRRVLNYTDSGLHAIRLILSVCEIGKYFWRGQIHSRGGAHARPGPGVRRFWTHSGPVILCQNDINRIVTSFNAVFKILLK